MGACSQTSDTSHLNFTAANRTGKRGQPSRGLGRRAPPSPPTREREAGRPRREGAGRRTRMRGVPAASPAKPRVVAPHGRPRGSRSLVQPAGRKAPGSRPAPALSSAPETCLLRACSVATAGVASLTRAFKGRLQGQVGLENPASECRRLCPVRL